MTELADKNEYRQACILMFAKAPKSGKVKTRLIPALGAEGACELHSHLLRKQLEVLNNFSGCEVQLWIDEDASHPDFSTFAGTVKLQQGRDLGEKMLYAANSALKQYSHVVIIGSDCPGIDALYLEQSLHYLVREDSVDFVFGPAEDGGYVLIGMRKAVAEVFRGIDWGSSKVMEQTRQCLIKLGLQWHELPELYDIDRPEDLVKLNLS